MLNVKSVCASRDQQVKLSQVGEYHGRSDFCQQISSKITDSHEFLEELAFSDRTYFQISGKVNGRV